jgi:hypothetical protein
MVLLAGKLYAQDNNDNNDESSFGLTGFDLQFINDSNPAKAEFERDIEETSSFRGRVTGSLYSEPLVQEPTRSSGISINALATYEHNADIEELGESRYRVSLDWFNENRGRSILPLIRFSFGLGYLDSETQIRDSAIIDLAGSINVQPTNFFDSTAGVRLESRQADTEVFDTTKTTLFLTGNFAPVERVILRTGLRYVIGDEVSTATPTLNIVNTANVIEPDDAFGGREANRFAYLLDANSAIFELGIGFIATDAIEANLLYRFVSTSADNDISYDRNMLELTLSYGL